jgi:hypothetical protein
MIGVSLIALLGIWGLVIIAGLAFFPIRRSGSDE